MIDAIEKRRSIRSYLDKKVSEENVNTIIRAAMYSPSAHNARPCHFIVVRNPETRRKLSKVTPWCSFAAESPVVIVVCGDASQSNEWIEDCSIASENLVIQAAELGLGTCFVQVRGKKTAEADHDSENYVKELLNIPEKIRVLFLITVGYPKVEKPRHTEGEFEKSKVHYEEW